jgi:O-antigen ligase
MRDLEQALSQLLPVVFFGGPLVAAALLALLIPVLLIGAGTLTMRSSTSARLSWIFILLIVGSTLSTALSGRTLVSDADLAMNPWLALSDDPSPWGSRVSQLCTGLVLLLAGAEWVKWLSRRIRMPAGVVPLWSAMLVYFLFAVVVSGLFGVFRNPRLNDIYVITVGASMALMAEGCDSAMWRRVRWWLLLPSLGSLLAIAVVPKLVLLPDFRQSVIPGVTVRLFGLSDHANALGVVAAVGLVLEFSPQVRRRPMWLLVLLHGVVLLLTQSKTAIVGAMLALTVVRWSWLRDSLFRGDGRRMASFAIVSGCVLLSLMVLALGFSSRSERLISFLDRIGVFTLTGRTPIWQVTIEEFLKNPVTGFGPSLWDLQFRFEHGMMQAGQAHNQFVQILGQAGLLGLFSMLAYLGTMARATLRRMAHDHGLAAVLLLMLLVRCMSESPLRMGSVMGWDAWLHLVAFTAAAAASAAARAARPAAPHPARPAATAPRTGLRSAW